MEAAVAHDRAAVVLVEEGLEVGAESLAELADVCVVVGVVGEGGEDVARPDGGARRVEESAASSNEQRARIVCEAPPTAIGSSYSRYGLPPWFIRGMPVSVAVTGMDASGWSRPRLASEEQWKSGLPLAASAVLGAERSWERSRLVQCARGNGLRVVRGWRGYLGRRIHRCGRVSRLCNSGLQLAVAGIVIVDG